MLDQLLKNPIFKNMTTTNLTQEEQKCLYNLGVKNFQLKNYSKASTIFSFLTQQNAANSLYFKSLAACMHATNDFAGALFTYKFAYFLNPEENADCILYCGICLFGLGQLDNAAKELNAYLAITDQPNEMYQKARLYLNAIKKDGGLA